MSNWYKKLKKVKRKHGIAEEMAGSGQQDDDWRDRKK